MDCLCFGWNSKKQKTLENEEIEDDVEEKIQKKPKKKNTSSCLLRLHISLLNSLQKWIDRNIDERRASRNTQNFVNTVECLGHKTQVLDEQKQKEEHMGINNLKEESRSKPSSAHHQAAEVPRLK
ncbi:Protein CBG25507 [Caenorhabditis briggsae]|uniref:Protein CBG25507 n=1 Tax=Caenorhabditis briggsae TaxID=6238 RepID=B6IEP7_CAEBR|nr:Protein CBG25507 [Caenorhabditis briggsae]CAR98377.1 Protein CBG25507 [Caenorhabditis briggsae]